MVGYGRVPSSMGTRNPFSRGVRFCPLKPVEISTLITQQAERRFKILDAVFEQEGDKLYVRHARDPTWDEAQKAIENRDFINWFVFLEI